MANVYSLEHRAAGIGKVNSEHNQFSAINGDWNQWPKNTHTNSTILNSFRSIEFNAESTKKRFETFFLQLKVKEMQLSQLKYFHCRDQSQLTQTANAINTLELRSSRHQERIYLCGLVLYLVDLLLNPLLIYLFLALLHSTSSYHNFHSNKQSFGTSSSKCMHHNCTMFYQALSIY